MSTRPDPERSGAMEREPPRDALIARSLRTPRRARLYPPHAFLRVCRSISILTRNHTISGPATACELLAAALSVRLFHQSASTVPCCIHVVLPLTRSTKPRSADEGICFRQASVEYQNQRASFSHKKTHYFRKYLSPIMLSLQIDVAVNVTMQYPDFKLFLLEKLDDVV